jgi:hypothetical protein
MKLFSPLMSGEEGKKVTCQDMERPYLINASSLGG